MAWARGAESGAVPITVQVPAGGAAVLHPPAGYRIDDAPDPSELPLAGGAHELLLTPVEVRASR